MASPEGGARSRERQGAKKTIGPLGRAEGADDLTKSASYFEWCECDP
jgi:hypothetical protein